MPVFERSRLTSDFRQGNVGHCSKSISGVKKKQLAVPCKVLGKRSYVGSDPIHIWGIHKDHSVRRNRMLPRRHGASCKLVSLARECPILHTGGVAQSMLLTPIPMLTSFACWGDTSKRSLAHFGIKERRGSPSLVQFKLVFAWPFPCKLGNCPPPHTWDNTDTHNDGRKRAQPSGATT